MKYTVIGQSENLVKWRQGGFTKEEAEKIAEEKAEEHKGTLQIFIKVGNGYLNFDGFSSFGKEW